MSEHFVKSRDGHIVKLTSIEKVELTEHGATITVDRGSTFGVSSEELDGFVPQLGDYLVLTTQGFSMVVGIIIEGRVIRNKSQRQLDIDHEQWQKEYRLKKLERYLEHGDKLKARAEKLPAPLRRRMERFAKKGGIDFWIDDASYEMIVLEGAAALLNKVEELGCLPNMDDPINPNATLTLEGIQWINDWWAINSKEHGYDYKRQMEMVPDFGEGHSGNTAEAARGLAVLILQGEEV